MKFPWWRAVKGSLTIEGRRLDATAPPLQAYFPEGSSTTGLQASGLIFPTKGCGEVIAYAGLARLTFVTLVLKSESQ